MLFTDLDLNLDFLNLERREIKKEMQCRKNIENKINDYIMMIRTY